MIVWSNNTVITQPGKIYTKSCKEKEFPPQSLCCIVSWRVLIQNFSPASLQFWEGVWSPNKIKLHKVTH